MRGAAASSRIKYEAASYVHKGQGVSHNPRQDAYSERMNAEFVSLNDQEAAKG